MGYTDSVELQRRKDLKVCMVTIEQREKLEEIIINRWISIAQRSLLM